MTTFIKLFHLVAVAHFAYGIHAWHEITPQELKWRKYEFGGKLVYLTFINFALQGVYFTIALLNDFIGSNKPTTSKDRPLIRKVRDYIFGTFAFPLAYDVGGLFWLLYAIDRELVFPKGLDAFFPWWLNHFIHTNILAFITLEMILLHHKYPCRKSAYAGMGTLMLGYLVWIHVIWVKANVWVYPVLAVLNWPQRIGFYAFTLSVPAGFFFLGEFLNGLVWGKSRIGESPEKVKSKKAKSKVQKMN